MDRLPVSPRCFDFLSTHLSVPQPKFWAIELHVYGYLGWGGGGRVSLETPWGGLGFVKNYPGEVGVRRPCFVFSFFWILFQISQRFLCTSSLIVGIFIPAMYNFLVFLLLLIQVVE